ncbi:S1C family serine protease [Aquabacterium sp.]|uniref:S1C family serine protease n=1 Tax=Aquabacterium sp. TaxID=1872578 RepID=UPI002B898553|nr:trypsin-like peptidase domain-containing protein [Aquabacterium sp.]HSW06427.1 trypsin-like peptidase domain-containing protein [Aquabacterium sp.]
MARTPLYSRTPQRPEPASLATTGSSAPATAAPAAQHAETASSGSARPPPPRRPWRQRHERKLWLIGALLLALIAGWPAWTLKVKPPLSVEQIDAAMRESIAKEPLASAAAAAYAAVIPSVVRVIGEHTVAAAPATAAKSAKLPASAAKTGAKPGNTPADKAQDEEGRSVGTGVVIVDNGLILTNLHVVAHANRITVSFFDGSESEAVIVSLQPENDLAVLRAKTIPDDLHAATLRSTAGLSPGDEVVAVGFPFGIGPSASQGVVSGLKREFRSPEGQRSLSNLIQFDAAANPGNSGGPLVTLDGHVVGIVTAIMNPNQQRTFIGIGFAVPIENAAAAVGMPPF